MDDSKLISLAKEKKLFINKTVTYMLPCLKPYGDRFLDTFKNFKVIGAFIEDMGREKLLDYTITVVSDPEEHKGVYMEDFEVFSNRARDFYNRNNLNYFVFDIPERFHISYLYFLQGKYSKMFDKKAIDEFFPIDKGKTRNSLNMQVRNVVNKEKAWKKAFVNMLNKMSKDDYPPTRIKLDDTNELDFLPDPNHEVIFKDVTFES